MTIRAAVSKFVKDLRSGGVLNNPAVPLSAAGFFQWAFGGEPTAAGEQVTVNTALQQITVYACVRVLSSSVASLPLYVYELSDGGRRRTVDHPVAWLLRYEPNDEMTAFTFIESMVGALALTGNAYAQIQRNASGSAVALWPLHPQLTSPKRAPNGDLYYETTDGMDYGRTRRIASADVVHVKLFSFSGLLGLSPIQLARQGIGLARAAEKYGARYFGNNARPAGVLTYQGGNLDPKQRQETRDSWQQMQGAENQGSVAVLPGQWTYHQIGVPPDDSQFLETRMMQRAEIAAGIYGVQPHMIGDLTRLSNNNHEQMSLQFVTDTLRPYLSRIEAELVRKLLPKVGRSAGRYEIEFDVKERLRGDFKTTMEGFAIGKQWGFFSTNTVLRELDMDLIGPEGDVYFAPVNMQNLKLLLNTESIQDQPVGADPNGGDGGDGPDAQERQLLGRFTRGYIAVYCDAFTRLLKRDKRDYESISALLGPVFHSIAAASAEHAGQDAPADAAVVEDALRAVERRAAKWPATPTEGEAGALAQQEFVKAVRAIHINVCRHAAAQRASQQLTISEVAQ